MGKTLVVAVVKQCTQSEHNEFHRVEFFKLWVYVARQETEWQQLKVELFSSKHSRLVWHETKEYVEQELLLTVVGFDGFVMFLGLLLCP